MRGRACAAVTVLLAAALAGCGGSPAPTGTPSPPRPTGTEAEPSPAGAEQPTPAGAEERPAPVNPTSASGQAIARVVRPTALRTTPGGAVVARLGRRTRFGVTQYLPVVRRDGPWLGVIATERPNGKLGWIRAADTRPAVSRTRLVVDLSQRRLRVLDPDGRTLLRMTVGVGAPATPTPTGRFAITDGLRAAAGSPYGCCILALSGHQPRVPQGWAGGDRLAIHGTSDPSTIGAAASLGCLHATDADLRRLMRIVNLGSIVTIRA